MRPIRLIAIDIDGTLLDSKVEISPANLDALCRAHEAGIEIVLGTGRRHKFALPIAESLGFDLWLISSNGAVTRSTRGEVFHQDLLPKSTALKLCWHMREFRSHTVLTFDREGMGGIVCENHEHLYGVIQRFLDGADVLDVGRILLHPALYDAIKMLVVFANDAAHAFTVEGQDRMAAEFPHVPAELERGAFWQQVLVKHFTARRAGHCAVGADEPQVEAQRLRDWERELVSAACPQDDLNAGLMGTTQGIQVGRGDLDFGVQERAIDIDGDEANGARHPIILSVARIGSVSGRLDLGEEPSPENVRSRACYASGFLSFIALLLASRNSRNCST